MANTQLGKTLSTKTREKGHLRPYLRNKNVQWHRVELDDVRETHFTPTEEEKYRLERGDLLVCEGGEVGRCAIWQQPRDHMYFQNALHRIRPHPGILTKWLEYVLRWCAESGRLAPHTSGVTISHLAQRALRRIEIPIAPTAEQRRIVNAIEEHFSRLDGAESSLRQALQQLHSLRSAVLVEAFHSNRGLPSRWTWRTIGDVAEVRGGIQKQPKRRPNKNPAPFLRVANVLRGALYLDKVHQIELFDGELEKYRLQAGDLLVVEGNGSPQQIGRAASWGDEIADCVHQNHLIRVRPGPSLASGYLALYWNAPHTASALREVASSTSGLYTLNITKIKSIPIPLAPLDEQVEIVERLNRELEQAAASGRSIRVALTRVAALRRAVLAEGFAGRLEPQDPTDEPAAVLLDWIAESRPVKLPRRKIYA